MAGLCGFVAGCVTATASGMLFRAWLEREAAKRRGAIWWPGS